MSEAPTSTREIFSDALRYWETRRIFYNLILTIVVIAWLVLSWPHFKPAFSMQSLFLLLVLAALANVCYCAAYAADLALQHSFFKMAWRRWRWSLWAVGTLFAVLLANYWIADEIYPFVR